MQEVTGFRFIEWRNTLQGLQGILGKGETVNSIYEARIYAFRKKKILPGRDKQVFFDDRHFRRGLRAFDRGSIRVV